MWVLSFRPSKGPETREGLLKTMTSSFPSFFRLDTSVKRTSHFFFPFTELRTPNEGNLTPLPFSTVPDSLPLTSNTSRTPTPQESLPRDTPPGHSPPFLATPDNLQQRIPNPTVVVSVSRESFTKTLFLNVWTESESP